MQRYAKPGEVWRTHDAILMRTCLTLVATTRVNGMNEWEYSPWLPSEYVNGQNVPYCSRKRRSQWWPPRSWHTPEFQWRHSPDSPLTHPPHPPPTRPKKLATLPLRIFIVFSGPKTPPFTTQIFPRALPKEFWTAKKCRLENPRSSLWLRQNSQNLSGGQAKGKPHGKWGVFSQIFPKALHREFWRENKNSLFFPQGPWGELWGKIWVENPHFPYGFLWPGWLGARHSQNLLGGPPSRPPKIWRPRPLNFQVPLWDENSQNPLGGGGHPSHPGQR